MNLSQNKIIVCVFKVLVLCAIVLYCCQKLLKPEPLKAHQYSTLLQWVMQSSVHIRGSVNTN